MKVGYFILHGEEWAKGWSYEEALKNINLIAL